MSKTIEELEEMIRQQEMDHFHYGLKEEGADERLQEIMDEYFAGISYSELRALAEENYPERFI